MRTPCTKQLQIEDLACKRSAHILFHKLTFQLNAGELLLIEGVNGAGKSSLLRLLAGMATPYQGLISWQQNNIQDIKADYWADLHYVGHTNGIKLGLSVRENLKLIEHLSMIPTMHNLTDVLTLLQLHTYQNNLACTLSAGQKRRLALAKLFLIPKTLWILDEPLTTLDNQTEALLLSHLEKHLQSGGMAIISSHQAICFDHTIIKHVRLGAC